jgi:predicted transposase/invertase (TIGR01784 family)
VSHDPKTREAYNDYIKWQNDQTNAKSHAFNKGKREGEAKGRMEGMREIAKNLLRNKVDINVIASSSGLSVAEIEKLR